MLQVSNNILNAISDPTIIPYFLVKFTFTNLTVSVTDAPYDIVYNNTTYDADGLLNTVSPPKTQADLSRDLFEISLGDPTGYYRSTFNTQSIGVRASIACGFINSETMAPLNEYIDVYNGRISKVSWSSEKDAPIVVVECSGPLAKLKQITNITTNKESRNQLGYSQDTSMDKAYDSENESTIKWGGRG